MFPAGPKKDMASTSEVDTESTGAADQNSIDEGQKDTTPDIQPGGGGQSSALVEEMKRGFASLTPQEKQVLNAQFSPQLAAVFMKLLPDLAPVLQPFIQGNAGGGGQGTSPAMNPGMRPGMMGTPPQGQPPMIRRPMPQPGRSPLRGVFAGGR